MEVMGVQICLELELLLDHLICDGHLISFIIYIGTRYMGEDICIPFLLQFNPSSWKELSQGAVLVMELSTCARVLWDQGKARGDLLYFLYTHRDLGRRVLSQESKCGVWAG